MRKKNRFVSFLLAAALCLGLLSVAWAVPAVIDKGTLSTGLTWELTNDGKLTISGNGPMPDWNMIDNKPEWYDERSSIKSVVIGDGVTTIGKYAFYAQWELKSVTIGDGVTTIGQYAFHNLGKLKSVTIGRSVTEIGYGAFGNCDGLESVTIPENVSQIGDGAFYGCDLLRTVTFKSDNPPNLGDEVFNSSPNLKTIVVPYGAVEKYKNDSNFMSKLPGGCSISEEPATEPEPTDTPISYATPAPRPAVPQYPVYTVNVNKTPGGQILHQRFVDATREATLTAVPDKGYKLESIKVTDKNGEEVALTAQDGGKYTFTMPGCDVNVDAVFSGSPVPPWENPFTDVSEGDWFYDAVEYVQENGLMNGTSATQFSPYAPTSRAMIATILWRQAGSPVVNYLMDFEDVDASAWYGEAVRWAASEGIVGGYGNGKFGPNDAITREQLATMLYNYEKKRGGGFTGAWAFRLDFPDVGQMSEWAYEPLCWCVMNHVIGGDGDGRLNPGGQATRAETATMLQRYFDR